jgi:glutamyl-tRNA synthetase
MPTYHLANVVDDHLMSISHVIRGEEWLPSMPLHVLLYRAFGWEATMPEFAHLALLLKPDGKGKLSKRDGDQLGFPVFPLQWTAPSGEVSKGYREEGYFKEAFINMISLLGWNPGTEQEIFSLEELGQAFDLTRVSKSGARFDLEKAKWFNQQYLRMQTDAQLAELFASDLLARGIERPMEVLLEIVKLTKERVTFVKDFWDQASFFFEAPVSYDEKVIKKRWKPGTSAMLNEVAGVLASLDAFDAHSAEEPVKALIEAKGYNMGQVMNCLRLALVGESKGPHLFDITAIIGKTETLARIARATANIAEA